MKLEKEMAYNRADFLRILPRALDSDTYVVDGQVITLTDADKVFRITHKDLEDRVLGGIRIPRAQVTLTFEGYAPDEAEQALKRFERYYHRGGG